MTVNEGEVMTVNEGDVMIVNKCAVMTVNEGEVMTVNEGDVMIVNIGNVFGSRKLQNINFCIGFFLIFNDVGFKTIVFVPFQAS